MTALSLTDGDLVVAVDPLGAHIGSIAFEGAELLMRTAWADEELETFHRMPNSVQEWHRRYLGGWNTMLPNAGPARVIDGVEHPFHGEAAWRTWRVIDAGPAHCTLRVQLRTSPLEVVRTASVREGYLSVIQSVRNFSAAPVRFTWAEHPTFGASMFSERTTLEFGDRRIDITVPEPGTPHGAFTNVTDYATGSYTLSNPDAGLAVTVEYDAALFPFTWVWQEHNATAGYPWWGTANAMGVEPACRPYDEDDGTLGPLELAPGATLEAEFRVRPERR